MSIARDLDAFIKENEYDIFIEAEGRPSRLRSFYQEYNLQGLRKEYVIYFPKISKAFLLTKH